MASPSPCFADDAVAVPDGVSYSPAVAVLEDSSPPPPPPAVAGNGEVPADSPEADAPVVWADSSGGVAEEAIGVADERLDGVAAAGKEKGPDEEAEEKEIRVSEVVGADDLKGKGFGIEPVVAAVGDVEAEPTPPEPYLKEEEVVIVADGENLTADDSDFGSLRDSVNGRIGDDITSESVHKEASEAAGALAVGEEGKIEGFTVVDSGDGEVFDQMPVQEQDGDFDSSALVREAALLLPQSDLEEDSKGLVEVKGLEPDADSPVHDVVCDEPPRRISVVEHDSVGGDNTSSHVVGGDKEEHGGANEVVEGDEIVGSDVSTTVTAAQLLRELEGETGQSGSTAQQLIDELDRQIVFDSEDEEYEDEDGDEREVFDSAALAALLKAAASGASSDGNITIDEDGTRVISIDRPAGLGSSVPALRPAAARPPRSSIISSPQLVATETAVEEMTEEEKKLHEKIEQIRVKFLRLVYRLGHSHEETVAAQVLYRLSLAEGIRRGRQPTRAFSLENAKKKALELEAEGKEELDFSCNILVLGKAGVGKSSTINSIFGEERSVTNAFNLATASLREVVGTLNGVKVRIVDTPGLHVSLMDQPRNRRILSAVSRYTKRCPPDIVLYVDRMDTQSRDLDDLPLLRTITSVLGSSIWFNAIVALTHAASAPPDGPNGSPMTYEVFVAQRSHVVQQAVRQAAGDIRLMNPVALVENHASCRRNREGQKVLPNGLSWRQQLLLLCYSSKILAEANSLLKLQDSSPRKLFGFRFRSPPLPFLLSSLLQSRPHPKLLDQGGDNGDEDLDLNDFLDAENEDELDEYDQLPPFRPLKKAQLAKLTKEQRKAYFDEYEYRVKLLQKKQWREELKRLKESKKGAGAGAVSYANEPNREGELLDDYDQDAAPATVPVPLPDMVLPPTFDGDTPSYRYRFLEPTSNLLARPVLDSHSWDHDCGYDGVSLEETLAIINRFPAGVSMQVTKDKKEFSIHLESSVSAKHGESSSSLAGFDIQTVGRQLAYILRGETKLKTSSKNRATGGFSVTFLGDVVATGVKAEDQLTVGRRLVLAASTGAMRGQGDTAYGANLEARLRDKDYPIGQGATTLGVSLMKWRNDLAVGANLQSQFSAGRGSKVAVRVGLNNKLTGQVTVRMSTSEQLQIALIGLIPVISSVYKAFTSGGEAVAY